MNKISITFAVAAMALGASAFAAGAEKQLAKFAPESKEFKTVYTIDAFSGIENGNKKYIKNNTSAFEGKKIKKIAYYMLLTGKDNKQQQVYVTMDPFSQDVKEIGVPAVNPAKPFQVYVNNMTVKSDVPGVKNGTFPKANIEFWATNYGSENSAKIPGADNAKYDFGDQPSPGNYGSMQIHNFIEKQTVMAYNHWNQGNKCDIGIGSNMNPRGQPDWTFSNAGTNFKTAEILVLVQTE